MKFFCELVRKISSNASQLHGVCYENYLDLQNSNNKKGQQPGSLNLVPKLDKGDLFGKSAKEASLVTAKMNGADYDDGAAMFTVIVICFYSLSIVFMVILNIKFKIVLRPKFGYCCYEPNNDLYESQKDETKNTIHMIFSDSSKLLTSVVIPPYVINAAFNERLSLSNSIKPVSEIDQTETEKNTNNNQKQNNNQNKNPNFEEEQKKPKIYKKIDIV